MSTPARPSRGLMMSSFTNLPTTSSTQAMMSGPWPAGTAVVTASVRFGLWTRLIVTFGYCFVYASKIAFLASRYLPSQLCQMVIVPLRVSGLPVPPSLPPHAATTSVASRASARPANLPDFQPFTFLSSSLFSQPSGSHQEAIVRLCRLTASGGNLVPGSAPVKDDLTGTIDGRGIFAEVVSRQKLSGTEVDFYPLAGLGEGLPVTVKVLLEGVIRLAETGVTDASNIDALAGWPSPPPSGSELPFLPARVLMQDFTGVPAVVDLAAMRSAMRRAGKDAGKVDPLVPVDLIIDHSVQVDSFGFRDSYTRNIQKEIERNHERYALLRWAQQAFHNFSLVPPGMGICHQVNLEYLAKVVQVRDRVAIPDTLMGTDSHTTMVNGLGVLGWGTGGIEAEAAILGQPAYLATPIVVGVRFHGALPAGSTATDLVLTLTEMLRKHGVVDKFVEFCGDGLSSLSVPDRATLSNMCPEYGATSALFPVDEQTLRYLAVTGRDHEQIDLVERYTKEQGLFRVDGAPVPKFTELLELDL